MTILIDNKSGVPIYDQIYTQLKRQIADGTLREDEALPSIRGLAKELRISVITTKRAYDELEAEGLIYTVAGKGSFVAETDRELLRKEDIKSIKRHLAEIKRLAAACSLSIRELKDMYDAIEEENK